MAQGSLCSSARKCDDCCPLEVDGGVGESSLRGRFLDHGDGPSPRSSRLTPPGEGNYPFHEQLSRHRTLVNLYDKAPVVHNEAFVAPSASITGDVLIEPSSSIWYGCVLRGDVKSISIGTGTNIQDNSLVHVAKSNLSGKVLPTIVGNNVTVGHSAILHGCTVEDEAFVGMGVTLLDGVIVETHAMVAAGALVRQNTRIPSGEVWGGNPAKFLRKLTDEEIAFIPKSASNYADLAHAHAAENAKESRQILKKYSRRNFLGRTMRTTRS